MPKASGHASNAQSIYRYWSNPQVTPEAITGSHRDAVKQRAKACQIVLAIQDTTDFDFSSHQQTQGLGFLNQTNQQGIKCHTGLAVSGEGEPLGVFHQQCWTRSQRSGKKKQRQKKPIHQKESYRWLQTLAAAQQKLPAQPQLVHVGDREADIFDLFAYPRRQNSHLLIRATYNRKVKHELDYLYPSLEPAPILGKFTLALPRHPQRRHRHAHLQIQALSVEVEVPRQHPELKQLQPVNLNAIWVEETETPADGSVPIHGLLFTTLPMESFDQAYQAVRWYSYRWLIERFHYTLKSGCRFEQLQLHTRKRLVKALATYSIVAWRLMWMTYKARLEPNISCDVILETAEWKLLRRHFAPKNRSKKPPTLQQAVIWIARLGGFLARRNDGPPGLKTLWKGLSTLYHWLHRAQLASGS